MKLCKRWRLAIHVHIIIIVEMRWCSWVLTASSLVDNEDQGIYSSILFTIWGCIHTFQRQWRLRDMYSKVSIVTVLSLLHIYLYLKSTWGTWKLFLAIWRGLGIGVSSCSPFFGAQDISAPTCTDEINAPAPEDIQHQPVLSSLP